jgi:putative endonuclease
VTGMFGGAPLQRTGARFESVAAAHLREAGLVVLARNYRCRSGEIDLVMRHGSVVVFVEVRYRRSDEYGDPLETITMRKRRRVVQAAQHFLLTHPSLAEQPCRFDAVGISGTSGTYRTNWIKDAFSA